MAWIKEYVQNYLFGSSALFNAVRALLADRAFSGGGQTRKLAVKNFDGGRIGFGFDFFIRFFRARQSAGRQRLYAAQI